MLQASLHVLANFICGVSVALILASGTTYTEARSLQGIPHDVKRGHSTYNRCRGGQCQIAHLNSVDDFCLWAPSLPALAVAKNTEHTLVAWCMKSAYGSRLIPDGTISGASFMITREYVQITGVGNLTNIHVPAGGVASSSSEDSRDHALVFTHAYGQLEQIRNWTSFVSQEQFCFRACKPSATAPTACSPIYDVLACSEDVTGNYETGLFEDCIEDDLEPSSSDQEVLGAPSRYRVSPSRCVARETIRNRRTTRARRATLASSSTSPEPVSFSTPTTTDAATRITSPSRPMSTFTDPGTTSVNNSSTQAQTCSAPLLSGSPRVCSSPFTSPTPSSSNFSSGSSTSFASTPACIPTSSYVADPSLPGLSSSQPSSYCSFTSSSTFTPFSVPPFSPYTPLQSSYVFTFSTPFASSSTPPMAPPSLSPSFVLTASPAPLSLAPSSQSSEPPTVSSLPIPSMSSQSSNAFTFTTPASSMPTTSLVASPTTSSQSSDVLTFSPSPATSFHSSGFLTSVTSLSTPSTSSIPPSSTATQLGSSQCPPVARTAVSAGSAVRVTALLPLVLTISTIVASCSAGIYIL